MRKIQIFSIIIFIIAVVVYGGYRVDALRKSDRNGPRITMEEESVTISCEDGEEAMLAGITATDDKDGDVTDSLIVETIGNFVEKGRRTITVAAFDSDNHVAKASREIVYSDYHSPRFALSAPMKFQMQETELMNNLSASDMLDGDVTGKIKASGDYSLDIQTPGEYPMEFSVSNSGGDVSNLPVTVEIYDPAEENRKPQITLSDYLVYTPQGTAVNPWDYVEEIFMEGRTYKRDEDGVLRSGYQTMEGEDVITSESVSISQTADYQTPGVYEITYQITDSTEETGTMRLIVVVSE